MDSLDTWMTGESCEDVGALRTLSFQSVHLSVTIVVRLDQYCLLGRLPPWLFANTTGLNAWRNGVVEQLRVLPACIEAGRYCNLTT